MGSVFEASKTGNTSPTLKEVIIAQAADEFCHTAAIQHCQVGADLKLEKTEVLNKGTPIYYALQNLVLQ